MASRYKLTDYDEGIFLIIGDRKWTRGESSYYSKRDNWVSLNVEVVDVNGIGDRILSSCKISKIVLTGEFIIRVNSVYNNSNGINLTYELSEYISDYALDVAKKYF